MMNDRSFFDTTMPSSRPADYYLGYVEGSVFLDFNNTIDNKVALIRISFDGYGCCELRQPSIPLGTDDSKRFKEIVQNNIEEQIEMFRIVQQVIKSNTNLIWGDALKQYDLI